MRIGHVCFEENSSGRFSWPSCLFLRSVSVRLFFFCARCLTSGTQIVSLNNYIWHSCDKKCLQCSTMDASWCRPLVRSPHVTTSPISYLSLHNVHLVEGDETWGNAAMGDSTCNLCDTLFHKKGISALNLGSTVSSFLAGCKHRCICSIGYAPLEKLVRFILVGEANFTA